jgi:ribose transport system ATP-binding protein
LTVDAKGAQRDVLVTAMLGHEALKNARPAPVSTTGNGLEITNLSSGDDFTDVSMTINAGEVVCLFGKIGSGSSEVLESIYGLRPVTGGSIQIFGKKFTPKSPQESSSSGIGYLPADRQRLGSFGSRSVAENLAVASWKAMSRLGFVDAGNEVKAFSRWSDALKISARRGPTQEIATLSGGNQQKVLLGRWFEAKVQVLLLVEPTRGVDVGARRDIYDIIRRQAKESGMAVLVATSDYEEVVLLADRALVMSRGKIVSEFTGNSVEATSLISAAS